MSTKQVSVFIENREGRLEKVTEILKDSGINIKTVSLADTAEFGLLRLIVSDAQTAAGVLKAAGFTVMITDVLAVILPEEIGSLHKVLTLIGKNVEYMYTVPTGKDSTVVFKVNDLEETAKKLEDAAIEIAKL